MTSTLGRLEAKGFVRTVPDARDGRSKRVLLTAAGREAREAGVRAAAPPLQRVSAALSPADARRLLPELQALREWLDAERD